MKTTHRSLLPLLSATALALVGAGTAGAQSTAPVPAPTIITSAPYTITSSGYYQLGANLSVSNTSGAIITVAVSNVTIDFGGHFISGPVNGASGTLFGVNATDKSNIIIKNGTVANCYEGIAFFSGSGDGLLNNNQYVHDMLVTSCTHIGINFQNTRFSRIEHNVISNTGGATASNGTGNYGFFGQGVYSVVTDNTVAGVTGPESGTGGAYGLYFPGNNSAIATRNRLFNTGVGIFMDENTVDKRQDNLTSGCSVAFQGGTDAGGNN